MVNVDAHAKKLVSERFSTIPVDVIKCLTENISLCANGLRYSTQVPSHASGGGAILKVVSNDFLPINLVEKNVLWVQGQV